MPPSVVYDRDPIFRFAEPLLRDDWRKLWIVFALYLAAVLVPKMSLSILHGSFVSPTLQHDFGIDIHRFPPFQFFVGGDESSRSTSTAIPLLRDYADLLTTIFICAHMALIHRQWYFMGRFGDDMWATDTLRAERLPGRSIETFNDGTARLMRSPYGYLLPLAGAALLTGLLFETMHRLGIYASLDPGTRDWQNRAFDGWWANGSNGTVPMLFDALFVTWIFYYIIRHNVVGVIALRRLAVMFPPKANDSTLTFLRQKCDPVAARNVMLSMVKYVAVSTVLVTVPFFMLVLILPSGGFQEVAALFSMVFVFLAPSFIAYPLRLFNRHVALARRSANLELGKRETAAHRGRGVRPLIAVLLDRQRLAEAPTTILSMAQVFGFVIVYLLPLVAFFDWGLHNLL